MFGLRRDVQRQLGQTLIAVALAVLAGQFGHKTLMLGGLANKYEVDVSSRTSASA
jgi:hypothetical protein